MRNETFKNKTSTTDKKEIKQKHKRNEFIDKRHQIYKVNGKKTKIVKKKNIQTVKNNML